MSRSKQCVLLLLGAAIITAGACNSNDKNEDITNSIDKQGSVESAIQVYHLDSLNDVLLTTHHVWKNDNEVKTVIYRDTIPSLGKHMAEAENEDGDTKNIEVDKAYQIFITVK